MSNEEWEKSLPASPITHHPSPDSHPQSLRIALVRQRYTAYGGAERFVERAMGALSAQGARLTIVTRSWPGTPDSNVLTCDPFYLGNLWRDWSFARCACHALQEHDFDLVQSHERIACCDIYRAGDGVHREWLRQRRRVLGPLGRAGIALNPYHRYVLAAEKNLFASPRLKAVICISRMVKEDILRHYPLAEDKLHVVYNGVDTSVFHPTLAATHRLPLRAALGIPPDAPLFLFVGSGFERKGLAIALRALAELPADAHLLVVGKDKRLRGFIRTAAALGLGQRTHFTGGQEDVKPYYGAADALVFPTLYEPFGNVALEALACGLPVLTSSSCGAAELIRTGENGFVCDALDAGALAAAMRHLLDSVARETMRLAARASAEPFGMERMGEALLSLYNRLLSAN